MNVIYDRIKKGFNARSCLSGSWWVDSGIVGDTACSILGKQSGGTRAHYTDKELQEPIIQIKS